MKFKVGDRVRVHDVASINIPEEYEGHVATIDRIQENQNDEDASFVSIIFEDPKNWGELCWSARFNMLTKFGRILNE